MITLGYQGEVSLQELEDTAAQSLDNRHLTVQAGENVAAEGQSLKITLPGRETVTTDQVSDLLQTLNQRWPDSSFEQLSLSNVSPAMGSAFLRKSLVAVVFALLLILLYIAFRFKKIGGFTGGMMAVLALANDLMVVFGAFVLLRAPLDGNFIAALLTILGYSINDTVVVYDGPPYPCYHGHYGDRSGCDVHCSGDLWPGQHCNVCIPADAGYDQRCVYFSVHFQLCLGRLERAQKARAFV